MKMSSLGRKQFSLVDLDITFICNTFSKKKWRNYYRENEKMEGRGKKEKGGEEEGRVENESRQIPLETLEASDEQPHFPCLWSCESCSVDLAFLPLVGDEVWGQKCWHALKAVSCSECCMCCHALHCLPGYSLSPPSSETKSVRHSTSCFCVIVIVYLKAVPTLSLAKLLGHFYYREQLITQLLG